MSSIHSLASQGNDTGLLESILTGANIHYQDSVRYFFLFLLFFLLFFLLVVLYQIINLFIY